MQITVTYEDFESGGRKITFSRDTEEDLQSVLYTFEDAIATLGHSIDYLEATSQVRQVDGTLKEFKWTSRF